MSRCRVPFRVAARVFPVLAAIAFAAVPAGAAAAQRLETFDLPSTHGNLDEGTVVLSGTDRLRATVLLPDGYDDGPVKAWPVVYLFHGLGGRSGDWADPALGDIRMAARGLPAIVVMPESGRGFATDWWEGGARSGPRWSQYFLDDVVPAVESRYRILPGRRNHAVAGASMGGHAAALFGGLLPGYFGTIVSLSGVLDTQSDEVQARVPAGIGVPLVDVWGPRYGPYATVDNPLRVTTNVANSRIYVASGNGLPDLTVGTTVDEYRAAGPVEGSLMIEGLRYATLAANAGAEVSVHPRVGLHTWPYWRRELPRAITWGLFAAPKVSGDADARSWKYQTMAPHGNAWGLGYRFAAPTTAITTIARSGQAISVTGGSGSITINPGAPDADASGAGTRPACSFTAAIPVTRTLPAGC